MNIAYFKGIQEGEAGVSSTREGQLVDRYKYGDTRKGKRKINNNDCQVPRENRNPTNFITRTRRQHYQVRCGSFEIYSTEVKDWMLNLGPFALTRDQRTSKSRKFVRNNDDDNKIGSRTGLLFRVVLLLRQQTY